MYNLVMGCIPSCTNLEPLYINNMSSESIIVYRSRTEQLQDEFWWSLVEDNPTFFAWVFGSFLGVILLWIVGVFIYTLYHFVKPKRRRW